MTTRAFGAIDSTIAHKKASISGGFFHDAALNEMLRKLY